MSTVNLHANPRAKKGTPNRGARSTLLQGQCSWKIDGVELDGGTLGMMLGRALLSSAGAEDVASQVSLGLINTLSGPWFTTIG